MSTEPHCLKERIDKYFKTIKNIGDGAFGEVSVADTLPLAKTKIDPTLPDQVAIKKIIIDPRHIKKQRVIDEIRILKTLDVKHSIKYYGCFEPQSTGKISSIYIVMEYFPYPDLWQVLADGPRLTDSEQIEILKQLAETIASLHDFMVAHRDLKPENIMVQRNPINVRLVDYGLSCYRPSNKKQEIGNCYDVAGTSLYMYPYIYDIQDFTMDQLIGMDWWSYGQVAYNVFTRSLDMPYIKSRYVVPKYTNPTEQEISALPMAYRGIMRRLLTLVPLRNLPSRREIFNGFGFGPIKSVPMSPQLEEKSRDFDPSALAKALSEAPDVFPEMKRKKRISKKPALEIIDQLQEQQEQQEPRRSFMTKKILRKYIPPPMAVIYQQQQEQKNEFNY